MFPIQSAGAGVCPFYGQMWPDWPGPSGVDPGEVPGARGDAPLWVLMEGWPGTN